MRLEHKAAGWAESQEVSYHLPSLERIPMQFWPSLWLGSPSTQFVKESSTKESSSTHLMRYWIRNMITDILVYSDSGYSYTVRSLLLTVTLFFADFHLSLCKIEQNEKLGNKMQSIKCDCNFKTSNHLINA